MDNPKIIQRRIYAAQHVSAVLPQPKEGPVTKEKLFLMATRSAKANGLHEEPYFMGDAARFSRFLRNHWGGEFGVRYYLAEDGILVDHGSGLRGIRRAGKVGAETTARWQSNVLIQSSRVHNHLAEVARQIGAQAPSVQLKLLEP